MELEITPEPPPAERAAIEQTVARVLRFEPERASAWAREGVLANVEGDAGRGELTEGSYSSSSNVWSTSQGANPWRR